MAAVSQFTINCSGLFNPCHSKLLFCHQRCNKVKINDCKSSWLSSRRIAGGRIEYFPAMYSSNKHVLSAERDYYQLSYENIPEEPLWISLIKDIIWSLKSLFSFLIEQPRQLKYIEWPSFGSTVKTAALTLVIVAVLIVALSSVDAVLCYVLALLLRRTP